MKNENSLIEVMNLDVFLLDNFLEYEYLLIEFRKSLFIDALGLACTSGNRFFVEIVARLWMAAYLSSIVVDVASVWESCFGVLEFILPHQSFLSLIYSFFKTLINLADLFQVIFWMINKPIHRPVRSAS